LDSVMCPPGQVGVDPFRLQCELCEPGYVCLGGTTTSTPTDVTLHRGKHYSG
jgi:hypothetical protein